MPNVVTSFYHDLSSGKIDPPAWTLDGGNWIFIFALILVPLCFLRHIDSLRHTSYVSLFSASKAFGFLWVSRALRCFIGSISDRNRYTVLLLATERNDVSRRDQACQIPFGFHINISCPGLCVYLCSERRFFSFCVSRYLFRSFSLFITR